MSKINFISVCGLLQECVKSLSEAIADEGGTDETLLRLRNKDTARAVARVLLGKVASSDPHLRVMVDGAPLQSMSRLRKAFDWVSDLFDGREWQYLPSCVDLVPGERECLLKQFEKGPTSNEAIAWGEANGYRPASHLEAIAFAKAYPELQRKFWVVALGSSALHDGSRCVAVLCNGPVGRDLNGVWLDRRWGASDRFLFVRK